MKKDGLATIGSLCALVALWAVTAWVKADASILPSPLAVLYVALAEVKSGAMWHHLSATLERVSLAFILSMSIGAVVGIILGRLPKVDRLLSPWMTVFLNIPALVIIVLCYMWIGLNEVAAIAAVTINKTAQVIVTLRDGAKTTDLALFEMAKIYRMPFLSRLRHVLIPQLAPYFAVAARNGIAMIWKIVLVVEFLGRSSGVGFKIHLYFQNFQTAHVLAYALSFVVVMLAVEALIISPWEARASRWRRV